MATEQQYIDRIRRKVSDFDEPRKYDIEYYQDAIRFALSKLSFDFDEPYSTPESVPPDREFLVVKLGTIEMCHVRAGESISQNGSSDSSLGDLSELEVPDLRVEAQDGSTPADTAEIWLKLASDLQKEYDTELGEDGGVTRPMEVGFLNTFSYRHGGLANRRLDKGLPAVVLGATVTGTTVVLSWSVLYHPEFKRYEIRRSTDNFVDVDTQIGIITDNHTATYKDSTLAAGTYQYKVFTVNPNEIEIPSNILEVVVV